jgi:hypothetical protein
MLEIKRRRPAGGLPAMTLAAAMLVVTALPVAQAAAGTKQPKIKVKPHAAMVGTEAAVTGSGFPAGATVDLRECGKTLWLAPKSPCDTGNETTVTANGKGRFSTTMRVELCPEGEPAKGPTERTCYIGEQVWLEDEGELAPAAKLLVSYP